MNDLLDDDDPSLSRHERELTLSTGSILGIFFGLVLLCGVCFGVGYNMGRKSAPTPLALNDNSGDAITDTAAAPQKPAAGTPLDSNASVAQPSIVPAPVEKARAPVPKPAPIERKPAAAVETAAASAPSASAAPDANANANRAANRTPDRSAVPAARSVAPSALMPGVSSAPPQPGSIMVQVAAVSHQEDADLLLGALRSRGYTVSARRGGADNFIHVQVGPFSNKKDAEAMRQRLLADGYNALLKF